MQSSETAPPTNLSAEIISSNMVLVSWQPPSDGSTVTGYILSYTDKHRVDGTMINISSISCDSTNISVQTLSENSFPSTPVKISFIPRKFKWSNHMYQVGLVGLKHTIIMISL